MRAMSAVMVVLVAACGGASDAPEAGDTAASVAAPVQDPAAAEAGTGTRHVVEMVMAGTQYLYQPATLAIKPGDTVVFRGISGGVHNVQFDADSLPAGAAAALAAVLPDKMSDLATNLVAEGDSIVVTFSGVPAGRYPYYCLPHRAMGMTAELRIGE